MVVPALSPSSSSWWSSQRVAAVLTKRRSPAFWKAVMTLLAISLLEIYKAGIGDVNNGNGRLVLSVDIGSGGGGDGGGGGGGGGAENSGVGDLVVHGGGGGGDSSIGVGDGLLIGEEDNLYKVFAGQNGSSPLERCVDADDPVDWMPDDPEKSCRCGDPGVPKKREERGWMYYHEELVYYAERMAKEGAPGQGKRKRGEKLDFALLGDSMVERWTGTSYLGEGHLIGNKYSFQQFFDKSTGKDAKLSGLALGSAGDTSANLLWHLQNGLLPQGLQPLVWVILIGTDDLANAGCSKRNTLAGILDVAQYLSSKRPDAHIVLHGLLPRSDVYNDPGGPDYRLGRMWEQITWINGELRRFCAMRRNWHYIESGALFVQKERPGGQLMDTKGAKEINPLVMRDGLHPTYNGYQTWGRELTDQISTIIDRASPTATQALPK